MFIFELTGSEHDPTYEKLSIENLNRQYDFLRSITEASLALRRPMLSIEVIKSFNYHAITCLHVSAGEFRPCPVTVGDYQPPLHFQVPALMQMFTNEVNRFWERVDALTLATLVLWRLNHIHPFVNGNGRTARVTAYYVLCLASGGWLPGSKILPERIVERRSEYVNALRKVDQSFDAGELSLAPLHGLLAELLDQQLAESEQQD